MKNDKQNKAGKEKVLRAMGIIFLLYGEPQEEFTMKS